jgi:hypothetical protein
MRARRLSGSPPGLVTPASVSQVCLFCLVCACLAPACAPGAVAQSAMPNGGLDPTPLAKCQVAASHEQPLVTEWPASYKARLEALLHEGAVAVEYSGCELRIVDTCRIPGSYAWKKTTLSTDTTDIRDEDDLYAKLPLGAVSLEGQLKTSGSLHVQTTVSGQMQLVGTVGEATSGAECSRATHLVTALSVGAFKLVAGGDVKAGAGVETHGVGVHGSGSESKSIVRAAGDPASCERATKDEPSGECRSPIQIFLTPIRRSVPLRVLSPLPDEKG